MSDGLPVTKRHPTPIDDICKIQHYNSAEIAIIAICRPLSYMLTFNNGFIFCGALRAQIKIHSLG